MPGEEVVYHDVPSPRPAPGTSRPVGLGRRRSPSTPQKKCSTFYKICIALILLCAIILSVVLTRPGALTMFGREPASAATPGFPTYMPTYVPTYFPTSAAMAEDATEDVSLGDIISGIFGNVTSSVVEEEEETVAISTAVEEATESVTDEVSMEDLIAGVLGNITSSVVEEEEEQEEETVTNSTAAAVSTTTPEATTTIPPHPVCGNATDSRVFQIQWTPEDENATYAFTDIDETTVYSEAVERQHTVGVQYEEKVCVLPGEYQFSMSDGACVNGYFRDELILFSCAEGSIVVIIEERVVGDNPEW